MRLIDTHCHLYDDQYNKDRDAVIERAATAGVTRIIIPGGSIESTKEAITLAQKHKNFYATAGIHPSATADFQDDDLKVIEALAADSKVVAIGEIGLDYYRDRSPRITQRRAFKAQLALAARLEMPIVIHNRESDEDMLSVLESWLEDIPTSLQKRPGVFHAFSSPLPIAEQALALGFYLSLTGPITYKKADELRRVATATPLDRILVETDGPYLTPEPHRGQRNEPAYIPYIIQRIADLKGINPEDVAQATTENAIRLFRLKAKG